MPAMTAIAGHGAKLADLRRRRMENSPGIFQGGFRPFFLGGAIWAVVSLTLWLLALAGALELPSLFDPLGWHRHEMLFGFVGAVVAGFLLTAVPNWTGRLPIAGYPLASLAALWLAARLTVLFSVWTGIGPAMVLDVGFYLLLAGLAAREVVAAKNRNVPIVGLVLLFGLANAIDYAALLGWIAEPLAGIRGAIALVVLMISLIGGRIIPSFTRNWMARQGIADGLPAQPGTFDFATIAATAIALLGWIMLAESLVVATLLIAAALLQLLRLSRWGGWRTLREPLVVILHLGYAWLPVGLLLLGLATFLPAVPVSAAIHALTAGAMGTMILAVMTRATLGHTGRELSVGAGTVLIYLLISAGALLRVAAPLELLDYSSGMRVAALAWGGAFLLFVLIYGPILVSRRAQ
jgi:uncharacterized protein involved in response to NO